MQLEGLWLPRWRSDTEAHIHFVPEVLYTGKSSYQRIEIVRLVGYGKCLILDGIHQSVEADEFIYHEAMVHPGMVIHPEPQSVLVIGGGEGAILREVLKYKSVKRVVMVEIDQLVVEKCRELLGWDNGAYEDSRVELIIDDGAKLLRNSSELFDFIVVDATTPKPGGIAYGLYGPEFFTLAYSRLSPNGILSGFQANANILFLDSHLTIRQHLKELFPQVISYTAYCPFYAISYAFCLSIKGRYDIDLSEEVLKERIFSRIEDSKSALRFYDEITHRHMFCLPKYIRDKLDSDSNMVNQEQLIRY